MNLIAQTRAPFGASAIAWALICTLTSCRGSKTPKEQQWEIEPKTKEGISAMVAKHNAVQVPSDRLWGYTIEVQEAIVRGDGRPVLVYASVYDITKRDGKYIVDFRHLPWPSVSGPRFILECSADQVEPIIHRRRSESLRERFSSSMMPDWYAVIASFSHVGKPKFCVEAEPAFDEEARVVMGVPDVVIATGRCLDLKLAKKRRSGDVSLLLDAS